MQQWMDQSELPRKRKIGDTRDPVVLLVYKRFGGLFDKEYKTGEFNGICQNFVLYIATCINRIYFEVVCVHVIWKFDKLILY